MADEKALHSCPECGTVQTMSTPFCENCGFRLKSQKTLVEGFAAIQPIKAPRPRTQTPAPMPQVPQPEIATLSSRQTSPEHAPVPLPEPDSQAPAGSRTVIGGMAAVPFGAIEEDAPKQAPEVSAVSSVILDRPSEASALMRAPAVQAPKVGASRLVLFTILWACIAAMACMLTYFMVVRASRAVAPAALHVSSPVQVPAGTLVSGLDEDTRAFILNVCLRAADDADNDCEQDKLLRGEFPQKSVAVAAFALDDVEVSNESYARCVEQGACAAPDYKRCKVYTPKGLQIALRVPKVLREPGHPVVCVTREQAQTYCQARGGALPTHEQWEWAARGSDGALFPWGNTWAPERANWGEFDVVKTPVAGSIDGFSWTAPVGQLVQGASPFGLHDMAGNVAEWVQGAQRVGEARGGSWTSDPFALRTTVKKQVVATDPRTDVGFRCAYPSK